MAEWATYRDEKVFTKLTGQAGKYLITAVLGCIMARANILGVYPFAIALLAVLAIDKNRLVIPGLLGIILGTLTIGDFWLVSQITLCGFLCILIMSRIKEQPRQFIILPFFTFIISLLSAVPVLFSHQLAEETLILQVTQAILAAGFSVIYLYAYMHQNSILKGEFSGDEGMVWILILSVCLSGLQGLIIGQVNLQIVVLSFFILYIADRYGAGSGAGAGAILGFLLKWNFGIGNLIDAGIYGLLGFVCGGFRRFGKIGVSLAYLAAILIITFFVNESFLSSHLYSSGLALVLFILMPRKSKQKLELKKKVMPEIETTVSKVKTLAEIFDQLAFGLQAAGVESKLKPEVPELMSVLVERICKKCPNAQHCWEREFYRTYNFMFDLFAYQEQELGQEVRAEDGFPAEWKKYCSRLQELMLGAHFILEQEKDKEVWQKRLALNQDALAEQYKSVSQVIGHLARELHAKHNSEGGKPLVWTRQLRTMLDMGVGTFIKTGNGISGDNYCTVPLAPNKSALIVCDGMGAGESAARMSSAALTILEQLLSTGFEPEGAAKALNSILVLRSPEESFVTIDMVILDLEADSARLVKIGAAPTYVLDKDRVDTVKTSSLPAGILNDIEIPVIDISFKKQTLVIITDGILDVVNKEEDWLKDFLSDKDDVSAQVLADKIIAEAMKRSAGTFEDDGVVLVVKRKNRDTL